MKVDEWSFWYTFMSMSPSYLPASLTTGVSGMARSPFTRLRFSRAQLLWRSFKHFDYLNILFHGLTEYSCAVYGSIYHSESIARLCLLVLPAYLGSSRSVTKYNVAFSKMRMSVWRYVGAASSVALEEHPKCFSPIVFLCCRIAARVLNDAGIHRSFLSHCICSSHRNRFLLDLHGHPFISCFLSPALPHRGRNDLRAPLAEKDEGTEADAKEGGAAGAALDFVFYPDSAEACISLLLDVERGAAAGCRPVAIALVEPLSLGWCAEGWGPGEGS